MENILGFLLVLAFLGVGYLFFPLWVFLMNLNFIKGKKMHSVKLTKELPTRLQMNLSSQI